MSKIGTGGVFLAIAVALVICSVLGWVLIWLSQPRNINYDSEVIDKSALLSKCYDNAYETYSDNWEKTCQRNNLMTGCLLNDSLAATLNASYNSELDRCVELYK